MKNISLVGESYSTKMEMDAGNAQSKNGHASKDRHDMTRNCHTESEKGTNGYPTSGSEKNDDLKQEKLRNGKQSADRDVHHPSRGSRGGRCSANCVSETIVTSLENFFYWYGTLLAKYPIKAILLSLVIPALCGIGLIRFKQENNPYKLWISQDSDYLRDQEWLWQNFPEDLRFHSVIFTADNVLTPEVVQKMYAVHKLVTTTVSKEGQTFSKACFRVPMVDLAPISLLIEDSLYEYEDGSNDKEDSEDSIDVENESNVLTSTQKSPITTTENPQNNSLARFRRAKDLGFDPSVELYPSDYCNLIDDLTSLKCLENSILELWAKDDYGPETDRMVASLSQQDILNLINTATESPVYDRAQDFTKYLGAIKRNESGHIVGAGATFIRFFGKVNTSLISGDDENVAVSKGSPVDKYTLLWEEAVIDALSKYRETDDSIFFNIAKSFSDLSAGAINGDALLFGIGTSTVFIYVQIMMGKFNFVEQRPGLSGVGMGCYGLSILTSYGFCSGVGLVFSPLHAIIPFLMMGIGVDDMFVIIQCLHNLEQKAGSERLSTVEKMGETMRHAGVAITVTSLTDFIVFAIGATTVLPALRSFCLYCAVGIISVYFYQATIFSAALSLDIRRVKQKRNGCFPFIKHKDWTPNAFSQRDFAKEAFNKLADVLDLTAVKISVVLATAIFAGFGIWGLTELKQEFNPIDFIPQESYLAGWFRANSEYFPKEGERVVVNIGNIDYTKELPKLEKLVVDLLNETDILTSVDSWYLEFRKYTVKNKLINETEWFRILQENQARFYELLTQFLFSQEGAKYRINFNFVNDLICGEAAPTVQLSSIQLTHKLFNSPAEWIPAMNRIKALVREANFSSRAFPTGTEYASWETDEVIGRELYQNLGLSLLCVFLTTLVLIASFSGCLFVLFTVLITLVDVGGFMHFWGLTVDVISCVNLVIAVGLVVDYGAHIVHCFLIQTGTRRERVRRALTEIGPAVLNGGFSTFLAFIFTAGSSSHVFITFFKIFLLVVLFGLFHGLVFLPVMLSLLGPASHKGEGEDADCGDDIEGLPPQYFEIHHKDANSKAAHPLCLENPGFILDSLDLEQDQQEDQPANQAQKNQEHLQQRTETEDTVDQGLDTEDTTDQRMNLGDKMDQSMITGDARDQNVNSEHSSGMSEENRQSLELEESHLYISVEKIDSQLSSSDIQQTRTVVLNGSLPSTTVV